MNANEITYGCEIECMVPTAIINAGGLVVGPYHVGSPCRDLPQGWKGMSDSSINAEMGYTAIEIVSPILRGAEGLRQVKTVVEYLKGAGAKVNNSTGFHVHCGFGSATVSDLRRLVHMAANHEKAIFAATGSKNRENNRFCKSVKSSYRGQEFASNFSELGGRFNDRYHALNVSNLIQGNKPTVEFRAFAGSLNVTKITGYIRMAVAMVEKATETQRAMPWDAATPVATSPIARSGEGQTELTRLFYSLGWTLGREDYTYGNITAEDLPSIDANKRLLMKMARKYDGQRINEDGERVA